VLKKALSRVPVLAENAVKTPPNPIRNANNLCFLSRLETPHQAFFYAKKDILHI